MRAAVLVEYGEPLQVEDLEISPPRHGEVLIRLAASGICGSDLHAWEGRSPVVNPPMVLGHEGAGIVEEVGPGVTSLTAGDHVVISLYGPCGTCGACRSGFLQRCDGPARQSTFGLMADGSTRLSLDGREVRPFIGAGTLAEYSIVHEGMATRIPRDMPLESAALIGCGVTTGIGAVVNTAEVRPGSTVVVIGCGGVGLNVIQGARLAGAARILGIDKDPAKQVAARQFGATDFMEAGPSEEMPSMVREVLGAGADYAFEVIGLPETVGAAFSSTVAGGTTVVVGASAPGTAFSIPAASLFPDRKLLGCQGGGNIPGRDIPMIAELYRSGRILLDELISHRRPLAQVNDGLKLLSDGDVTRVVVAP